MAKDPTLKWIVTATSYLSRERALLQVIEKQLEEIRDDLSHFEELENIRSPQEKAELVHHIITKKLKKRKHAIVGELWTTLKLEENVLSIVKIFEQKLADLKQAGTNETDLRKINSLIILLEENAKKIKVALSPRGDLIKKIEAATSNDDFVRLSVEIKNIIDEVLLPSKILVAIIEKAREKNDDNHEAENKKLTEFHYRLQIAKNELMVLLSEIKGKTYSLPTVILVQAITDSLTVPPQIQWTKRKRVEEGLQLYEQEIISWIENFANNTLKITDEEILTLLARTLYSLLTTLERIKKMQQEFSLLSVNRDGEISLLALQNSFQLHQGVTSYFHKRNIWEIMGRLLEIYKSDLAQAA